MIIGPKYKIGKRLGAGVFEKCQTQKFSLSEARSEGRGKRRGARSDYGKQFLEKQRVRYTYGITEKQFKNYIIKSNASKTAKPADALFRSLETRADNVVYRLGFAPTRRAARQMVSHGHILINKIKTTIPSQTVKVGDLISVREGSKESPLFKKLDDTMKEKTVVSWLSLDTDKKTGTIKELPTYNRTELHFDLLPVLEFYSR